jgi:hypothetical protein
MFIAQEIVKNALPANSSDRASDMNVRVEKINIRPGREVQHVESAPREELV